MNGVSRDQKNARVEMFIAAPSWRAAPTRPRSRQRTSSWTKTVRRSDEIKLTAG